MIQAAQVCDACRERKKKCDKALPVCTPCKKRLAQCRYSLETEDKAGFRLVREKVKQLENLVNFQEEVVLRQPHAFIPDPQIMNHKAQYPVAPRWYYPMLLHFRFHSMVPCTTDLSTGSAAYKLRTAWVEGYMSDPCMFHAVLYAASANLDLINKEHDNPVTAFHRAEAIRLTYEQLSRLKYHEDIPATVVSASWVLAHIARLTGNIPEAKIHESGLGRMIIRKGRPHLGFNGAISFLIMLSDIWNAVINQNDPTLEWLDQSSPPCSAQPRRTLLGTALHSPLEVSHSSCISCDVLNLLHIVDGTSLPSQSQDHHGIEGVGGEPSFPSAAKSTSYEYLLTLLQVEQLAANYQKDFISESCCLAAIIYWKAISANVPFMDPDNQAAVQRLRVSLHLTDSQVWMEHFPQMHSWVCYVGAMASPDILQRAWFVARSKISVVILRPESVESFRDGVSHLLWLSKHLVGPMVST